MRQWPGYPQCRGRFAALLILLSGWYMKFTIVARAAQVQGYKLGKVQKGRPNFKKPVRRKPDKFVL